MQTILIIDDDISIGNLEEEVLERAGYAVLRAYSGTEALLLLKSVHPSLILLDLMLPGLSGEELLPLIKNVPIIVVSAKAAVQDKVDLLLGGAADYITKPFLAEELLLRCRAVLKRTYSENKNSDRIYKIGDTEINMSAGTVKKTPESEETALTNKEYKLLNVFLENRGRILTFDFLAEAVWGENYYAYENTLMVHIRKLREKIELNPSNPKYIITMKGLGYRLNK